MRVWRDVRDVRDHVMQSGYSWWRAVLRIKTCANSIQPRAIQSSRVSFPFVFLCGVQCHGESCVRTIYTVTHPITLTHEASDADCSPGLDTPHTRRYMHIHITQPRAPYHTITHARPTHSPSGPRGREEGGPGLHTTHTHIYMITVYIYIYDYIYISPSRPRGPRGGRPRARPRAPRP